MENDLSCCAQPTFPFLETQSDFLLGRFQFTNEKIVKRYIIPKTGIQNQT
jgi:hypothetical protein